jgi:hypothetical protein
MKVMVGLDQDLKDALPEGIEVTAGDTHLMWDANNEDEVSAMKATFDKLKRKGYLAFAVQAKGEKGQQVKEFDPKAAKLIMAPPMQGG